MQLRRYCVTVMDNWTPIKFFWTKWGAEGYIAEIPAAGAHVRLYRYRRADRTWQELGWTKFETT